MKSLTAVISIIFFLCGYGQSQDSLHNYSLNLKNLLDSLSISDDRIYMEIDKSEYILTIMSDTLGCISLKNKDRHPGYHRTIAIA